MGNSQSELLERVQKWMEIQYVKAKTEFVQL